MSLLRMSKNRKVGSTWGRIRDSFFPATRRCHGERKNRRLRIDPLEERTLLSVSPADVVANLVNSVSSTGMAATVGAQSVAMDENGDFVVAWTRLDLVHDSLGDRVIDPETEDFMVEANVYARYYTNEVQQIVLPEGVKVDDDTSSYATADIDYGGNEVQLLTITSATWTEFQEDTGQVRAINGSFKLWLDVNGDGVQDVGEVTDAIGFSEEYFNSADPAQADQATLIQNALQALGGDLADVVVTSIDSLNYTISFGDASGGVDQDLLVVINQSFSGGNLASASVSPVLEPFTISFVISPDDPLLTAHSIEDAFQVLYDNRFQATTNTAVPDNDGVNVMRTAIPTVSVTSVKTADDPDGLRTFNIEFTDDSALTDVPTMVVSSVVDEDGDVLVSAATAFEATTIKEPSPEFRVNPEEPDNPFTALPDKYHQYNACVAMDADGDFIIAWEGEVPNAHNSGSVTDIFARLFQPVGIVDPGDAEHGLGIWEVDLDNDGVNETQIQGVRPVEVATPYSTLLSDTSPFKVADDLYTFRANEYTTNAQSNPSVAMDSKGSFAISWSSGGQDISYFNSIYVRSFSSDGSPINAVEVMVNEEVTDSNDDSFVALSDDGYYVVVWVQNNTISSSLDAKLFDPDGTVALDQFVVVSAGSSQIVGPSATFDTANNFFVGWAQLNTDPDANGLMSTGYYAVEYDVAGVQIRDILRVNSADLTLSTFTSWPLDQYNGQVVMDADGDLTVIYEGFGPDVSENAGLGDPLSRAVLLIQDLFSLEENQDLAAVLPVVLSGMFTLPLPVPLGGGNTSGDVDGVIEEMLIMAVNSGATQSQVGRMYAIFNSAVGLLRGEADGIMYSQFDTDPNLAQSNVLNSDTIVNSLRDGNNSRFAVSLSLMAAGGDFTFTLTNDVTGQTMAITLTPVYIDKVLMPDPETTAAFDAQMEAALSAWGVNWNRSDYEGLIDVRYMTAAEATTRNDSYWPLRDEIDGIWYSINPNTQHIWEFTFQGEIHDTSISMNWVSNSLVNANGDLLDDIGVVPPQFVGMPIYTTEGLQTGTVQHSASVAITADGDFVVVYTEDEKNAAGAVTNQNIFYRFYDESTETAGPTVASVETTDGQSLDGTQVYESDGVTYIALTMSEKMYDNATSTGDAATNTDNYVLYDASGDVIEGAVAAAYYGLNKVDNLAQMAADDPTTYGGFSVLNSLPSNKYEIVLVIDANGTAAGVTSLGTGTYTLELLSPVDSTDSTIGYSGLRDAAGTPLNRTGYVPDGENTNITFSLVVGSDDPDLTGTEILVNDTTTGVQTTSSTYNLPAGTQYNNRTVAVDADGDYVVVWISYGQDGDSDSTSDNYDENYATSAGVYMQLFNSEGHALTVETLVNTHTIGNQTDCAVAIDADGDFVVVWVGEGQDSDGSSGIYGQRFDSMGWKIGGEFQVNTNVNGDQINPSVAVDSHGNFVVAWASVGQAGSSYYHTIRAQTYNSDGVMLSSEIAVNDISISNVGEAHPQVALSDSGFFAVVWSVPMIIRNGVVTDTGVVMKHIDLNGATLFSDTLVNTTAGASELNSETLRSARNAQVAINRAGDLIVVVWEGYSEDNEDYDIYRRHYQIAADGTLSASNQFQVNVTINDTDAQNHSLYAGDQVNASVAIDANNNFIITWNGNGIETNAIDPANALDIANADTQGVWARTFTAFSATSTQKRINVTSAGYQGLASVGMTTAGDAVVVWSGNGSGDTRGVYAKIVDEPSDTAGPMVTDFLLPDGTPVTASGQIMQPLYAVVVSFDEELLDNAAHTGDAATNPANYALLIDGVEVAGGISQVFFGLDKAHDLSPQYGLNAQQTNKYQAVLIVDANGASEGVEALTDGRYQIVVKATLRDVAGNPLHSTGLFPNGAAVSDVIFVNVPTGQETLVSDGTDQIPPQGQHTFATTADSVASDADGDYVVAWTDETPGQEGVWIRMYEQVMTLETDGTRTTSVVAGNEILVSSDVTASDISVARDVDGDFVVTWSALDSDTSWDVYAQRFNAVGQMVGNTFRVNSTTANVQRYSSVALDAKGNFVITWQSNEQDGDGFGVYAQAYNTEGRVIGGIDEIQAINFTDGFTGTFKLRWDDDNNTATPDKVTGPIAFTGNSTAALANVQSALEAIGANVKVVTNGLSELLVQFIGDSGNVDQQPLWISPADVVKTGGGIDAQVTTEMLNDGQSGEFLVNDTTTGDQMFPDVAMDAEGNFIVTWTSSGQDYDLASETNVYAKRFSSASLAWNSNSPGALGQGLLDDQSGNLEPFMTTIDNPFNHLVDAGTGYDAVVLVIASDFGQQGMGTGTLLAGTNWILTAAHVVWSETINAPLMSWDVYVGFDLTTGTVYVPATQVVVHPDYLGNEQIGLGNDIALIQLEFVPPGVEGFPIYTDFDEVGQVFDFYGYGKTGTGSVGSILDPDYLKRHGRNVFDATGATIGDSNTILLMDFDDGTAQHDYFGVNYGIHNLDTELVNAKQEANTAQGDSGGPAIIDGKIAGICSYGFNTPPTTDVTDEIDSSYGEVSTETRISAFADWIQNITNVQGSGEFLVNADDKFDVFLDAAGDPVLDNLGNWVYLAFDNQSGNQSHSSVAVDSDGDFVITWTSYNHDGIGSGYGTGINGENGVFARRYNANVTQASGVFQVNQTAEGNQQNARVSMDADGDFTVTWESNHSGNYDVYTRRYASTSDVQYAINYSDPVIPLLPVGNNPLYQSDLMFVTAVVETCTNQHIAAAGLGNLLINNGAIGGEFRVNTTTNGDQRFPGLALDDTGDAVIVWSGNGEVPGQQDTQGIFLQRFVRPADDAGPQVGDMLNVVGTDGGTTLERVLNSGVLAGQPAQFVVTFGEDLSTHGGSSGAHSVLNLDNWQLTTNGQIVGGVVDVQYGFNAATNKYEAVITFDGDQSVAGNQPLGLGTYTLSVLSEVQDIFGNGLDGAYTGTIPATDFVLKFTVASEGGGGDDGDDNIIPPGPPLPGSSDDIVHEYHTSLTDVNPAVAADANGNYVVAWETAHYDVNLQPDDVNYDGGDIAVRQFDRYGQPLGVEFIVTPRPKDIQGNVEPNGAQIEPAVAMDDFGDFVVVWAGEGEGDQSGIFATIFDKDGFVIVSDFLVNQYTQNIQSMPAVAMDADGDFVVTWTSYGQDGDMDGVYARRFNVQGMAQGSEFRVNTTTMNRQDYSDIAVDDAGNFVVTWRSDQLDSNSWGIYGQQYSAAGAKLGGEFRVNTTTLDDQIDPAVAMDADGDFVVVWSSFGQDGSGYGVYGRRYNAAGTARDAAEFRVNQTTLNYQWTPDVGMTADGGFVVTWSSLQNSASPDTALKDYGIYARVFNADGSDYAAAGSALGEFRVNAILEGNQVTPAIAVSTAGRCAVVWGGPDSYVAVDPEGVETVATDMGVFSRVFAFSSTSATSQGPVISRVAVSEALGFMSWNTLDPDGVASSLIVINGISYTGNGPYPDASGVNYSAPISALPAGTYNYTITAVDNAGNASQLPGSFTLIGSSSSSLVARKAVYSGLGRSLKLGLETSAKLDWLYDIDAFEVGSDKEEGNSSSAVDAVMATY